MYPFTSRSSTATAAAALAALALPTAVSAGANAGWNNIAVYWGQNSAGGASTQGRLAEYCANTPVNIIPLAFMNGIRNPATVNFGSASDSCTTFSGSNLLDCPQIEEDIIKCQELGKIILLSIGGATYSEGGFDSELSARGYADKVWAMFGPKNATIDIDRPFGSAVVDGFDFDFESAASNLVAFGQRLRDNMDAATGTYYLSAAPQCPYPDAADGAMLAGAVAFDFVMVQFYNNYCGVQSFTAGATTQNNFNFDTWDSWAKTESANKNVKVLLGVPASASAAGSGYIGVDKLTEVIDYCTQFDSFGGVMMWDMSQLYANSGYLDGVEKALTGAKNTASSSSSSSSYSSTTTTTTTSTSTQDVTVTLSSSSSSSSSSSVSATTTSAQPTTLKTSTRPASTSSVPQSTSSTSSSSSSSSSTTTAKPTSTSTSSTASTSTSTHANWNYGAGGQWEVTDVPQYNQCGGQGWQGLTKCRSPYSCVCKNEWFCLCE